jgi:AcrR family transcriptional regulator
MSYAGDVFESIPIPGTARAKLIHAAVAQFGTVGYEDVNVTDLADAAGVTTGALYHHFGSKLGLYRVVREEMERRIYERMDGAAAAAGGVGRSAIGAALLVGFDAAVRFGVARLLSESRSDVGPDRISETLASFLPRRLVAAAPMLVAGWRGALAEVAAGTSPSVARAGLAWVMATERAA